jgi:hypothetical protein
MGNEVTMKHNALVKQLEHLANYAGVKTRYEPTKCFYKNNSNKKPDIRFINPKLTRDCVHDVLVDVSVAFLSCFSCIETYKSDKKRGAAAVQREKHKIGEYVRLADNHDLHFTPLVLESYGTWGEHLIKLVHGLVDKAWAKKGKTLSKSIIMQYWVKRISVTLQMGNADMFISRSARLAESKSFKHDHSKKADNIRNSVTSFVHT